ncbi:unnamed protein product [Meloidogyne enterolobii]|uniref:Uncharacterized protein n=1 Tax=Meloidogyne enterolobii TaxID=390850 RepID=A0ACB0XTE9_MELEN
MVRVVCGSVCSNLDSSFRLEGSIPFSAYIFVFYKFYIFYFWNKRPYFLIKTYQNS